MNPNKWPRERGWALRVDHKPSPMPPADMTDHTLIPWPPSKDFIFGQTYSRGEIRAALGGDLSTDFPHRNGRVVCGCFNPRAHPDAPDVVLPGRTPDGERWARVFAAQHGFIPCFVEREADAWEYVGHFCVRRTISDAAELTARAKRASRSTRDLSMALYLRGN